MFDPDFNCRYKNLCPDGPWDICQNCIYGDCYISNNYDEEDDEEEDDETNDANLKLSALEGS